MKKVFLIGLLLGLGCWGCASSQHHRRISSQEQEAIRQMLNAVSSQELSDAQIRKIAQDIQKDSDSQEAIDKILFHPQDSVIKYSPATGKHYSGHLEFDPETGVRLEALPE